jgi:hypothetical protein
MSRPKIVIRWQGRFGNMCMKYLHCRAYAEAHGCELQTQPWIGQQIFQLHERLPDCSIPDIQDYDLKDEVNVEIDGYSQHEGCLIYTREQAKQWLKLKPEVETTLRAMGPFSDRIFHLRRGDYAWLDYILISADSYRNSAIQFGYNPADFTPLEEGLFDFRPQSFSSDLAFLPDLWRLMQARILFRSNSTFAWLAAMLGNAEHVYSPKMDGMTKPTAQNGLRGLYQFVPFVEGNWPAIAIGHDHCTDLHLKEP